MAEIKPTQHVFIAGGTGSGKTFLAKNYLAGNEKQVFVLDTKGTFEWEQIPEKLQITCTRLSQIPNAAQNYKFVIYRPVAEEKEDEFFEAFFTFCYDLRNCTVYVDEAFQVCPSSFKMPKHYKYILTAGRELNVNVWSATQRPSGLPLLIYSEPSHWFIFRLNAMTDREKLAKYSGFVEFEEVLPQHVFLYYDVENGKSPVRGKLVKGG